MNHAVEVGSGVMMHVPSFMNTGSGIQQLMADGIHTHRQHADYLSLV